MHAGSRTPWNIIPCNSGRDTTKVLSGVVAFNMACEDMYLLAMEAIFGGVVIFDSGSSGDLIAVHGHCQSTALN